VTPGEERRRGLIPPLDRDGRLVVAGKVVRSVAFGINAVALGLYLAEREVGAAAIGVILSSALVGTTLLTLVVAVAGDRIGRRRLLGAGAALMTLAALIPALGGEPALLALVGLSGMVAVNSGDSTGLQTIDQALLPGTVPSRDRTAAFALYGLLGTAGAALGGLLVGPLEALGGVLGLAGADRFTPAFVAYAVAGAVALVLALALDPAVDRVPDRPDGRLGLAASRPAVVRLSALFALDSLASGFVVQSFLALWFATRHGLDAATLGVLFAAANLLSALSFPASAWLATRLGLVRTMVFTHLPGNLLLIGVALVPSGIVAALLYLCRAGVSSMDVPARQSYLMAIVSPGERTAAAGYTNLAKSMATSAGPLVAGALLVPLGLGVPLIACGLLKSVYDVSLYALFRSRPAPEEAGTGEVTRGAEGTGRSGTVGSGRLR
jgi:MFS family permease